MAKAQVDLISLEIRKWLLEAERLHFRAFFVIGDKEFTSIVDLSLTQVPDMVEEFVNKFRQEARGKNVDEVVISNEGLLRPKLNVYFKKILSELNNNKRRKGQSRQILSNYFDVYVENQDLSFLDPTIQFYVLLNWARRYYEKEDFSRAIDPLKKLLKIKKDYGIVYKWLARSLKKMRKYDEAMRYYEMYAKVEKTVEARLELAKSYRKGKLYDKSAKIYSEILKKNPAEKDAKIGLAQIKYARMESDYLPLLDELNQEDPEWLRKWLLDEFNFRIYATSKTALTPIQAAKFLGFEKAFDITQKAFKNELPSHFNPSKARMHFFKEELENWAEIMNRFNLIDEKIVLQKDHLKVEDADTSGKNSSRSSVLGTQNSEKNSGRSTRVEEIIRQIREAKAKRNRSLKEIEKNFQVRGGNKKKSQSAAKVAQKTVKQVNADAPEISAPTNSIDRKKLIAAKKSAKAGSGKITPKKRTQSSKKKSAKSRETTPVELDIPNEQEFLIETDKS
ncbi:MAG: tetratricopeptide repeat protein [bacterium]|nr:MAG: tetratricopeptide repeat protein [bacterium]